MGTRRNAWAGYRVDMYVPLQRVGEGEAQILKGVFLRGDVDGNVGS